MKGKNCLNCFNKGQNCCNNCDYSLSNCKPEIQTNNIPIKPTLAITLEDYKGGFEEYGTITTVNGVKLPFHNTDRRAILEQVLEYIGYEVKITEL